MALRKYSIIYRVRGSQVTDYIWYDEDQKIMLMRFKRDKRGRGIDQPSSYIYFNVSPTEVKYLVGEWPTMSPHSRWYNPSQEPINQRWFNWTPNSPSFSSNRWFNADPKNRYKDELEEMDNMGIEPQVKDEWIRTHCLGYYFNLQFKKAHPMYVRLKDESILYNYVKSNRARRQKFLNILRQGFLDAMQNRPEETEPHIV